MNIMNCPLCGSDIEVREDIKENDIVDCSDRECPASHYGLIVLVDGEGIIYLSELL